MTKRVLLVDDDENNLLIAGTFLDRMGLGVVTATTGLEGLSILYTDEEGFDLVIVDYLMPGMNGVEMIYEIRNHPKLRILPIIMLTAKAFEVDRQTAKTAGANLFMTKPYKRADLVEAVEMATAQQEALKLSLLQGR